MSCQDGTQSSCSNGGETTETRSPYVRLTITCSARGRVASDSLSRYPKIGYFGHEVFVQQYVLRFQIAMNNPALARVQKLHACCNLRGRSVDNIEVERELKRGVKRGHGTRVG